MCKDYTNKYNKENTSKNNSNSGKSSVPAKLKLTDFMKGYWYMYLAIQENIGSYIEFGGVARNMGVKSLLFWNFGGKNISCGGFRER